MKIVILTDSLGLPRDLPESVSLEETYIDMLRNKYVSCKILNISLGGATVNMLYDQYMNYYCAVNPDLIILQSGIVDCAPRALKRWELSLVERSALLKKVIKKNTRTLRKYRNITYTSLDRFKDIVRSFHSKFDRRLYWVGILPASPVYEEQVPGINSNIAAYNMVLQEMLANNFIDTSDLCEDHVMSDHHHLNLNGNMVIFNKLSVIIDSFLSKNFVSQ